MFAMKHLDFSPFDLTKGEEEQLPERIQRAIERIAEAKRVNEAEDLLQVIKVVNSLHEEEANLLKASLDENTSAEDRGIIHSLAARAGDMWRALVE